MQVYERKTLILKMKLYFIGDWYRSAEKVVSYSKIMHFVCKLSKKQLSGINVAFPGSENSQIQIEYAIYRSHRGCL